VTDAETAEPLSTFRVVQGLVFANDRDLVERGATPRNSGVGVQRQAQPAL